MKRKIPLIVLCVLFLGIAGVFGGKLYRTWKDHRSAELIRKDLAQYIHLEAEPADAAAPTPGAAAVRASAAQEPEEETLQINWPTVDFEALRKVNPDVVAWIYIEGTDLSYPVLQGEDNSYYLYRLLDGSDNIAGSIFLDYRSEHDLSGRNSILYGHNMKNGSMFKTITYYKEQAFYDEHPRCMILTPDGNYLLEFFAGYVTDLNSQAWKMEFASDEEYAQWLEEAVSQSVFTSNTVPSAQDRVVTLSTCSYEFDNARFVLLGILKQ